MNNVLVVSNLKKTFYNIQETKVLNWVNIEIKQWEVYGFLWPNWSWKTTTLKCILWFLNYDEWEIKIFDEELKTHPNIYKLIWYAPENAYFYDHLNWIEFLIFMWELVWMGKQEAELNWLHLMEKLWLDKAKNRFVKSYSKWMRQRLWLAASLINDPKILFWDEPMSWLDPLWRVLVKELMLELKSKWKTIFFNTHILSDVQEIADKFWIIFDGKIIFEDYTKNLQKNLEELFKELIQKEDKKIEIR